MKKSAKIILPLALLACVAATPADSAMRRDSDGMTVVNSTTLCNARGFRKTTPVEVYFKKDKIVKVVALRNEESPNYFEKVKKHLIPRYNNIRIKDAKKLTEETAVDGCTGATYSTKAVQKNIKAAIDYYETNK